MKPYMNLLHSLLFGFCFCAQIGAADLVLSPEFRFAKIDQMPSPASHPGLQFTKKAYTEENAIEWQVRLKGPETGNAPFFENGNSADFILQFPKDSPVNLHWNRGSHAEDKDFQPHVETLTGKPFSLESFGGRSADGAMPYFNLASGEGGLIVALGWSGDWKATFTPEKGGKVRITAGLKKSRFKPRPGEELRLPSVLVMGYRGSWMDGMNQFRRLSLRHFTPTNHPPMKLMPVAASVHGMFGFNVTTEKNLSDLARDIAALKLPLDTFWLDAGWNQGGFPASQGNPDADPVRFPNGLGPVGQTVAKTGMRFLVWFEPERAMRGTWLERNHPEWLMSPTQTPPSLRYMENDGFRLVDLANKDARRWALDTISKQIREANISVYRQDFNEYPSYFWHTKEPADEVGLREVRYINGLYDFLDELVRRHPGLIIDNCASGGRRIDFEINRRSVVLWRSDSCWDSKTYPRNVQAMTHGLSHWVPLHGLGSVATDPVSLRSGMGSCASYAANFRDPAAVAGLRKYLETYLPVRSLFMEDFYPLTDWTEDTKRWLAFQFHDPKTGKGIVQAFSGPNPTHPSLTLNFKGLDPNKHYKITDWDTPKETRKMAGFDLMKKGYTVKATTNTNQAVVLQYEESP